MGKIEAVIKIKRNKGGETLKDKLLQSIPITFEKIEDIDERFMNVKIYLMHTGLNKNGSYFEKSVVETNWSTLYNTPILGFIQITKDNEKDFEGHKNILVVENGKYKLKYAGFAYGVISESCNPRWEFKVCDDGIEREFLVVDGVIWRKFEDAAEIFDRDQIKQQSMELADNFDGYFDEQHQYFVFTKFAFYGACALGDDKNPAMINASIEKVFSVEDLKQEFQDEMEQLKSVLFSVKNEINGGDEEKTTNNNSDIESFEEGGNVVDEKLALIAKYSTLGEDLIKELKDNIEQYSIEQMQEKINFELSSQIKSQLSTQLRNHEKVKDSWGYEYSRYYFVDYDPEQSTVYAEDGNDNWNIYKFTYSMNGDNVVINFESGVKQKVQFIDFDEGTTEQQFAFVPGERFETISNTLSEKVSELEQTKNELSVKVSSYEELQIKYTTLEQEKNTLVEYKNNKEIEIRKQEESDLFTAFSEKLTEEELNTIKENASNYSIEELEKELFALAGKKIVKFSFNKKPKLDLNFEHNNGDDVPKNQKPYADIVKQYVKNK